MRDTEKNISFFSTDTFHKTYYICKAVKYIAYHSMTILVKHFSKNCNHALILLRVPPFSLHSFAVRFALRRVYFANL